MVSQGSVVSELEFTELSPELQSKLAQQLGSVAFDVSELSFASQCDCVKFCFHQLVSVCLEQLESDHT